MPRPLIATIDIAAMQSNFRHARALAGTARVCAIVKANAYGHGLLNGMRGFSEADSLGLVELEGAARLREAGWNKPIVLLEGVFEPADLATAAQHGLDIVVHSVEQLQMLEAAVGLKALRVHLKMNTGMNRLGLRPAQFREAYARLKKLSCVRDVVLMTHFANAETRQGDLPGPALGKQLEAFNKASDGLAGERSFSNSAASLWHSHAAADWIRPGIMLYGATPGGISAQELGLKPAMALTSKLIAVQQVEAGETVGYGGIFTADKPMRIGVVACGYADGYPRHAPSGTPILVDGRRARTVGRVSMDMITVDLAGMDDVGIGAGVTLWGPGLPIDEVAAAAGTIGYELMCALTARVKMVAVGGQP